MNHRQIIFLFLGKLSPVPKAIIPSLKHGGREGRKMTEVSNPRIQRTVPVLAAVPAMLCVLRKSAWGRLPGAQVPMA